MTPENMVYWLQGYLELTSEGQGLTAEQVKILRNHLQLVFRKETPELKITMPNKWQDNLSDKILQDVKDIVVTTIPYTC